MDVDYAIRKDEPPALTDTSNKSEIDLYERWERSNRLSMMYIKSKISASIRGSLGVHKNVCNFLKAIDEQFESSEKALASTLMSKLSTMKLTSIKGVREHIMRMRDIAAQLKTLEVELPDSFLVYSILNSLPHQYGPFKISYNTHKQKWSINEVLTMCVQEEGRLLEMGESAHLANQGKDKSQAKKKGFSKPKEANEQTFYVPSFSRNFISISKLVPLGYSFEFSNNMFKLFFKYNIVGNGTMSDGLFRVQLQDNTSYDTMHASSSIGIKRCATNENSSMLWHRRLGHISLERVKSTKIVESRNAKFLENDLINGSDQTWNLHYENDHIETRTHTSSDRLVIINAPQVQTGIKEPIIEEPQSIDHDLVDPVVQQPQEPVIQPVEDDPDSTLRRSTRSGDGSIFYRSARALCYDGVMVENSFSVSVVLG
ncbi:Retrovirus-related Pol polyprotein from transposon TNT 1-94 [Senna tora]|uniref:Retrovirus-related Pol polyprotein from transposon TNT 1-94 n=1 Tax=Senna tora TaxID=362788 RepID=A0A834WJD0_9FABA|nr:Retrovirus-related Pol polyprotein from transposon TNT 1-94 [Senna tora]